MDVALCVPTVDRVGRLRQCLESAEQVGVDFVCVADNGPPSDVKQTVFDEAADASYAFNTIDVPSDMGLGAARVAAFEAVRPFAQWIIAADDDHVLTDGIWELIEQLEHDDSLGGLAGDIVEPEHDVRWQSAKDFIDDGDVYRRTAAVEKTPESIRGRPMIPFDFIPYPAVYRRGAIEDYGWDDAYPLGRCHADFYMGHWLQTDWRFGINPDVTFRHYPGDDSISATRGDRQDAMDQARQRFREKWGKPLRMGEPYWTERVV